MEALIVLMVIALVIAAFGFPTDDLPQHPLPY
jgi:hypothetical protein